MVRKPNARFGNGSSYDDLPERGPGIFLHFFTYFIENVLWLHIWIEQTNKLQSIVVTAWCGVGFLNTLSYTVQCIKFWIRQRVNEMC